MKTLADLMPDYDAERIAQIERDDTPESRARATAKAAEEFERGVRLGWHDEEGNPIPSEDDDAEDDEEDEEEYDDSDDDRDGDLSTRDRENADRLDMGRNEDGEWLGFC